MIGFACGITLGIPIARSVETLIRDCRQTGTLNRKAFTDSELRDLIRDTNRRSANPYLVAANVVVSCGLVVGIWATLAFNGIYPSLGPAGDAAWQSDLYAGSWLGHGGIVGAALVGTQLVTWSAIVTMLFGGVTQGILLVALMRRAKREYGDPRGEYPFVPVFEHPDGVLSQGHLRRLFVLAWIEVIIVAVGIGMVYFWLPKPQGLYVAPMVSLYIVLNPLYALLPFVQINHWNEQWKRKRIWALRITQSDVMDSMSPNAPEDTTNVLGHLKIQSNVPPSGI